jgi:hypothetical protein
MPWKYVMPNDVASLRHREATLGRIAAFWDAFARRLPEVEARLRGEGDWDLVAWMDEQLAAIHPRLRWEFSGGADDIGGWLLVVSPESAHHLRPLSESVVRRAPQVPGWTFREYRPSRSPEQIPHLVRDRTGHNMGSSTVQVRLGDERRVDFIVQSVLALRDEHAALEAARAAVDYLIGEDVMQRWGGHVDVAEMSHAIGDSFVPLVRVPSQVLTLITGVLEDLPNRPYCKMPPLAKAEWKRHAPKHDDFAGQDDAMFGTTVVPEVREATAKPGFYSVRYSRQGETFCHLKIDASDAYDLDERYKRKKHIEEAIDAQLRDDGIGAVVGTATGRRYLHFDLAVLDVVRTLEAARRRLLALELLPARSWLLFYDADLAGEYIGLRSATPPPPLWEPPVDETPVRRAAPAGPVAAAAATSPRAEAEREPHGRALSNPAAERADVDPLMDPLMDPLIDPLGH